MNDVPIPALISRAASWYADRLAVVDDDRQFTFREVEQRSNRLAHQLLQLTPERSSRVALLLGNRAEFVEADFAIAKSAKTKVPINPRLTAQERDWILTNSGADVLIVDGRFADYIDGLQERVASVKHILMLETDGVESGLLDYEKLICDSNDSLPQMALEDSEPSFILYTSGTTGQPKGAVSTQRGRRASTLTMLAYEIESDETGAMLHAGSVAHGSGSKILAYFLMGARNIMMSSWSPDKFLHQVEKHRVTGSFLVPTMMSALADEAAKGGYDFSSLRAIAYGGAPIAPARLEYIMDVLGNRFVQVYGSCEAPHPLSVLSRREHLVGDHNRQRLASVGRETIQTEIRLVDSEGSDVEPGESGEMCVRGPHVMKGYWDNPEATDLAFRGEWYRTGDVALRDDEGYLHIVDRVRDLIISGGLNVYPSEVEAHIYKHPAVAEAAVIGVPDEKWGESVKAIVALRPGTSLTEAELVEHCRSGLAGYKKPSTVEFVEELPKGATGKILKKELRKPYWDGQTRNVQ